jgi:SAM-dependent methyltransferase
VERDHHQRGYWDSIAEDAEFTHPVDPGWLKDYCGPDEAILDYGCGYGRVLADLRDEGYHKLYGVDPSPRMIARARREVTGVDFQILDGVEAAFDDNSFDLVLLVAILTCVPDSDDQRAIVDETSRLLKTGGFLYVSDFPLQDDERNLTRYRRYEDLGFDYGTFEIDDGRTVMRHHAREHFETLFSGFGLVGEDAFSLVTMKGHPATGIRLMLQTPHRDQSS